MRHTALALALLALATPLAAAKTPVELAPSRQWNVDFARDKCQLIRTFGEGENKHFLRFQQYDPGDAAGLTVAGPALFRRPDAAPDPALHGHGRRVW